MLGNSNKRFKWAANTRLENLESKMNSVTGHLNKGYLESKKIKDKKQLSLSWSELVTYFVHYFLSYCEHCI
jgi:hypothetical protein